MEPRDAIGAWFFESLTSGFASAFEAMTGHKVTLQAEPLPSEPRPSPAQPNPSRPEGMNEDLTWRQTFRGLPGAVSVKAERASYTALGQHILQTAGLEARDEPAVRTTYLELVSRGLAGMAEQLSGRLGREVTCGSGEERLDEASGVRPVVVRFPLPGDQTTEIVMGADQDLVDALFAASQPATPAVTPKTLDLLLDVELPVSVSFGRAQIALKDVLKLTTGSILELDRTIAEPVEVIVNNCAIARGEVVVVEGNFGVRVLQVISRQERLKTVS